MAPVVASAQGHLFAPKNDNASAAEIGTPYFRNYGPKEYGAAAQNWAIAQDQRGVMYFGNNSGVLEYDGVSWRIIPTANSTVVRTLAVAPDGRIYVGAQDEIGYLDPDAAGQLQYVSLRERVPEEYREFSDIAKSYATSAGVYFQALDRLMLWSQERIRVWKPVMPFHLSFVVHDRFYVRQPEVGLLQMEGDSLQLVADGEKFSQLRIYCMLPLDANRILIGTREQGLFLYDGKSAQPFPTEAEAFLLEHQLYHGTVLPDGNLAFATLRGGVVTINRAGKLLQVFNRADGLQDEIVRYIFSDQQQGLWLALNNGITRVEMPSPLSIFNERAGLKGSVEAIQRHQARLYVATHQGVYYLQPRALEQVSPSQILPAEFKAVTGIAGQSWSLLSVEDLLLAATRENICQIENDHVTFALPVSNHAYVLYRSRQDSTLVYVGRADGLVALRLGANSPNKIGRVSWKEAGRIDGIDTEVRSMAETNEGMLWLGTRSQGVIRVDFSAGFSLRPKVEKMDSSHGLPAKPGWTIVFSADGQEFFANDAGIFRFENESQRFLKDELLGKAVGENDRIVVKVSLDHAGNIWFGHGSGILEAIRRAHGDYEWLQTPFKRCRDFYVYAILPEEDEVIWFGGPDGLLRYDANVYKDYGYAFSTLIRKVVVEQDSVIWAGAKLGKTPAESHGRTALPELEYARNALRFEYSASSYDDESANQFQYYLEGFDKGWSALTKEKIKDYTNVSEGEYLFRLRARNIYEQSSAEAAYAFKILPPWYRTWWAYLFYFSGLAAIVFGFIKYRTRQLVQRSRALEKVVQQRTEEIRQQAEELETLDGIVKNINREVELENVLRSLLEQGLKLFPQAEKASVLLLDHAAGLFKFAAAAGYDLRRMKGISFTPAQLAQRYTEGSEQVGDGVYIVRNLLNLYSEEKLNAVSTPISVLAMTAVRDGQVQAYLVFDNFSNPDVFSHSDAHKLSRFRSHAISAVVKAITLQELQEKNAEIIRTQQQLITQEKLASLGALTAGIAHEIKNPLNFVNNFAELSVELAEELEEEFQQQRAKIDTRAAESIAEVLHTLQQNAQKINEHGKRADSIVRGMLQHSRTQAGERESTDINVLLQQTVTLSYHGMRAQENGFNMSIQEDYDTAVGNLEVMPQDLSRVFLNIINNACYALHQKAKGKVRDGGSGREGESGGREDGETGRMGASASPAGTVTLSPGKMFTPTLWLKTKDLGDKVEIRIRDNGFGIPAAVLDKIFNPFFTTKPTGQGTGLGLSISYDIIQKHGGEIAVDTEEGSFTEFIIHLPKNGKR
ncbi:MAG: sensor histidine kinase [bacterium]